MDTHIGIRGVDQTDRAAKDATVENFQGVVVPPNDFISVIKAKLQNMRRDQWREVTNNKL